MRLSPKVLAQTDMTRFDYGRMSETARRRAVGIRPVMANLKDQAETKPAPEPMPEPPPDNPRFRGGMPRIAHVVSEVGKITPLELRGKGKSRYLSQPRQIAYLLIRERSDLSSPAIASYFNTDYTTVLYGAKRAERLIETSVSVRGIYDRAVAILDGGG